MTLEEYFESCGEVVPVTDFSDKPDWMREERYLVGKKVRYCGDTEHLLTFIGFYEDKEDFYYGLKNDTGRIAYASCIGGIKED